MSLYYPLRILVSYYIVLSQQGLRHDLLARILA
jgi:hypothetical protein